MNQPVKRQISQTGQESNLQWPQALPLALLPPGELNQKQGYTALG